MRRPYTMAEQLRVSMRDEDEPFWEGVYQEYFGKEYQGWLDWRRDPAAQAQGIDRVILLTGGRGVHVDEKLERQSWTGILLEYVSVDLKGALGWVEKEQPLDYIAYCKARFGLVYMLPCRPLKRAWAAHREEWKERASDPSQRLFRHVETANEAGYRTRSVVVPARVLFAAMSYEMTVKREPLPRHGPLVKEALADYRAGRDVGLEEGGLF